MKKYCVVIVAVLAVVVTGLPENLPECPTSRNIRIPHPTNCTLYYACQNGEANIRICPEGLHFDNAIRMCNWPKGCISGTPRPNTQPTTLPDPRLCMGECPEFDSQWETIHLPYWNNCSLFCKCSNGKKFVFKCKKDLHFDQRLSVCNWPIPAKCPWRTKFIK
ncbi:hypothetical protein PUN28_019322 [Cardiocondyla obscurior]|uniref:Chitin-binding type-2 domain-containing protein n=1 Tax=Cardiocondyla obscurior TaxID=286306 RepID=A0AAW2EGE5_9HYME